MSCPKVTELTADPTIGEFYLVPCVQLVESYSFFGAGDWIPVLTPLHTDAEIGVKYPHWHYDYRFFDSDVYERILRYEDGDRNRASSYQRAGIILWPSFPYEKTQIVTSETPEFRRLKCKRTHNRAWPTVSHIHPVLEAQFKDARVKNHTCPHRGVSMLGCKVEVGKRICPAHGLVWDAETGELITGELAELHRRDQTMMDDAERAKR